VQADILKNRWVTLQPMKTALRAGGEQYKGSRTLSNRTYSKK